MSIENAIFLATSAAATSSAHSPDEAVEAPTSYTLRHVIGFAKEIGQYVGPKETERLWRYVTID